jgi:hypothetical protein
MGVIVDYLQVDRVQVEMAVEPLALAVSEAGVRDTVKAERCDSEECRE